MFELPNINASDEEIKKLLNIEKVVWRPFPGAQELALTCPANEILLQGTRGPGKTDTQLMMFKRHVGQGYGRYWRGIIFDRAYKNLDDLVDKSHRWFNEFGDGAKFFAGKSELKWVWKTGETLLFRVMKKENDYYNYHGQEFPFIGWNELTKYPSSACYDAMMSCNRSSFLPPPGSGIPKIPLVVVATTNPYGVGHNWVKRMFIDPAAPGMLQKLTTEAYNPATGEREQITRTRTHIFFSYKENPRLDAKYIAGLEAIKDENKRRAWLLGDWSITAGGAFDDLWGDHLLTRRFPIPKGWRVDRSLDWGSSKPYSVGWWAEANGEEITMPDGQKWAPVAGSLFRIYELYGTSVLGSNEGVRQPAEDVAEEIRRIDEKLLSGGWIQEAVQPGPADNSIRAVADPSSPTTEANFNCRGVYWTNSDKTQGSRKIGLELARQRMKNAKTGEGPGMYFFTNCKAALYLLPTLSRDEDDPDDVDTEGEDHLYDDLRFRVLSSSYRGPNHIDTAFPR